MWNLDTKMFSAVRRSLLNLGSDADQSVCLEVGNGLSSENGWGRGKNYSIRLVIPSGGTPILFALKSLNTMN
jgi:hypothetical protein